MACNLDQLVVVYSQSPWPCCDDDHDGRDGHDGHHGEEACNQSPWPYCDVDGDGHYPDGLDWTRGVQGGHTPASGAPV